LKRYEDIQQEITRRKRERWAKILDTEPAVRRIGRRRRDPEKEALLLRLDRARLARREQAGAIRVQRVTKDRP
jgi:hypothetical protein